MTDTTLLDLWQALKILKPLWAGDVKLREERDALLDEVMHLSSTTITCHVSDVRGKARKWVASTIKLLERVPAHKYWGLLNSLSPDGFRLVNRVLTSPRPDWLKEKSKMEVKTFT